MEKKGENPVKLVRFEDGEVRAFLGSVKEVEKEIQERFPEKKIIVII